MDRADFTLADGSVITRDVSECRFAPLNPLTRAIRPMRLMLAACS